MNVNMLVASLKRYRWEFLGEYENAEITQKMVQAVTKDYLVYYMTEEKHLGENDVKSMLQITYKDVEKKLGSAEQEEVIRALKECVNSYAAIAMSRISSKKEFDLLGNKANLNKNQVKEVIIAFIEGYEQSNL